METIMIPMGLPRWLSYKESASKQVMGVWSPGQEDSLEMEKQGGLQPMLSQKSWT